MYQAFSFPSSAPLSPEYCRNQSTLAVRDDSANSVWYNRPPCSTDDDWVLLLAKAAPQLKDNLHLMVVVSLGLPS